MIDYFSMPETPGVTYFACERLRAKFPVGSCAQMWRQANHEKNENRLGCKGCPIGAAHAGETTASLSRLRNSLVCGRRHRSAHRLVGKHLCVSCKNREYEYLKGRNAKGTMPIKLKALEHRTLHYMQGDEMRTLHLRLSVDTEELIVSALRDSANKVRFLFSGTMQLMRRLADFTHQPQPQVA